LIENLFDFLTIDYINYYSVKVILKKYFSEQKSHQSRINS